MSETTRTAKQVNAFYLLRMLFRPVSTSRKIASCTGIRTALLIVIAFAIYLAYGFATSQQVYPPPLHELEVWINAWGEFAMLPVLPIAAEHYRTFLAIIIATIDVDRLAADGG